MKIFNKEELKELLPHSIIRFTVKENGVDKEIIGSVANVDDDGVLTIEESNTCQLYKLSVDNEYDFEANRGSILKKVKENFKKKRGRWYIFAGYYRKFEEAYDEANKLFDKLIASFDKDEKEKFHFNCIQVDLLPSGDGTAVSVTFKR